MSLNLTYLEIQVNGFLLRVHVNLAPNTAPVAIDLKPLCRGALLTLNADFFRSRVFSQSSSQV
jgi:hypothetical protein